MSPVCNAGGRSCHSIVELEQEPETDQDVRWEAYEPDEDEGEDECSDPGVGIKKDICSEDA